MVVIGGGPSLSFAQIRRVARARLEGRCRVIAVNDQVYFAWWADWLHACDSKWPNEHIQAVQHFAGIRTTLADDLPPGWRFRRLGNADEKIDGALNRGGFVEDPTRLRTGGNGAFQAVGAAVHAGARRVVLIGVDMKRGANGESHCHGGHRWGNGADYAAGMLRWWATLVEPMRARAVEIINCSPGSAIDCFPMAKFEDVL